MRARPDLRALRADLGPILHIAAPAMLTNLATPIGGSFVLKTMAQFGDGAVAGAAIMGRIAQAGGDMSTARAAYDVGLAAGLAEAHGLALIVDETYRDFHSQSGAPHPLFEQGGWDDTLIHLYSFSKAYRLTGHRVGAMATSAARLEQVEKYMDSTTICTGQLAQRAALWGLNNLRQWVAGERAEILNRRAAITQAFAQLEGWTLRGCGAYFAFVDYPFSMPSHAFAQELLARESILALPGSMFTPKDDARGQNALRIAFANIDLEGIAQLHDRLRQLSLAPLPGSA